jgi:hypothetical protein
VTVSIVAPAEVDGGSSFVANVTVDYVENFNDCGFDVTYNQTIITVINVTGGEIDGHTVEVGPDDWSYIPADTGDTGRTRVLAIVPGVPGPGVNGTGHIAQIHFNVLGSHNQTSAINLEGVGMYDYGANGIATTTVNSSVHVTAAPLEITTTSLPEAKVGDAYSATLNATGGKTPYTWVATGLPTGLNCSTAGVISGTPSQSGDFTVTVNVTDSFSTPNTDGKVLALKVYAALQITTTSLPEAKVGDAYSVTLNATGGKPGYTWVATGLPAGLNCSTAGVISGTPSQSDNFTVTVNVTDSFSTPNTEGKVLALKVYAALQITTTSLPNVKLGNNYSATLEATGGKIPYTWNATGLPAGLNCSLAGVISGTPTVSGNFTVTVNVTDSFTTPNTEQKILALFVCILGDANGDGVVDAGDVTKVKRIYFELDPPTDCADVNGDKTIDSGDITGIKIIYFGLS